MSSSSVTWSGESAVLPASVSSYAILCRMTCTASSMGMLVNRAETLKVTSSSCTPFLPQGCVEFFMWVLILCGRQWARGDLRLVHFGEVMDPERLSAKWSELMVRSGWAVATLLQALELAAKLALLHVWGIPLQSFVGGGFQHSPQFGVILFLGHDDCSVAFVCWQDHLILQGSQLLQGRPLLNHEVVFGELSSPWDSTDHPQRSSTSCLLAVLLLPPPLPLYPLGGVWWGWYKVESQSKHTLLCFCGRDSSD